MEKFAERLKELREDRNLSVKALARNINYSHVAILHWESKLKKPSADALIALSKFFKVSTDYLLGLEDN